MRLPLFGSFARRGAERARQEAGPGPQAAAAAAAAAEGEGEGEEPGGAAGDAAQPVTKRRHNAFMIMILALLSCFFVFFILGLIAWVMAAADLRAMRAGKMDPEGMTLTMAGRTCAVVGTVMGLAWMLPIITLLLLTAHFGGS